MTQEIEESEKEKTGSKKSDGLRHYVEKIKQFYFGTNKVKQHRRIAFTIAEILMLYPVGSIVTFLSPQQLFIKKNYGFFSSLASAFSFSGILIFAAANIAMYILVQYRKKNDGPEYKISEKGTYGTAKHLNGTEDEQEILKRIPNEALKILREAGNIIGYDKTTDELIIKEVNGNSNRNMVICGGPGTGKSRTIVRNLIFQCVMRKESMFLTDPKGGAQRSIVKSNGAVWLDFYQLICRTEHINARMIG